MSLWVIIYRMAGIVGVNPDPYTCRELAIMASGRQRENWRHTSELLAHITRAASSEGSDVTFVDFYPFDISDSDPKEPTREEAAGGFAALRSLTQEG